MGGFNIAKGYHLDVVLFKHIPCFFAGEKVEILLSPLRTKIGMVDSYALHFVLVKGGMEQNKIEAWAKIFQNGLVIGGQPIIFKILELTHIGMVNYKVIFFNVGFGVQTYHLHHLLIHQNGKIVMLAQTFIDF